MTLIDFLRQDYLLFAEVLAGRRTVTAVTLPPGARLLWALYLVLLAGALRTLRGLLDSLDSS